MNPRLGRAAVRIAGAVAVALAIGIGIGNPAAQAQIPGQSTLGDLITPRGGSLKHFASTDPNHRNGDARRVNPGQTYTLMDYNGSAGIVRRFWVTIAPRNNVQIQRQAIVRCYWDGEESPSVECPISDFFGMGFGEWRDFQSVPLAMTSGGYNCYWAMPFHKSARIMVENRSKLPIDALYYNIDVETHDKLPKDTLYFHAQFRREKPTTRGKDYTLLETTGKGQYVGTLMSMQNLHGHGFGFLEGNEEVSLDGENTPSIQGTGTEDYFCSGWYFDTGVYSARYHGVTIRDEAKGRICAYRWHIEDAIPFEKSIKFAIQHGPVDDVQADYSSVAFYYQTHPHPPFPPLPADLLPTDPTQVARIPGMIEAESLLATAQKTTGDLSTQDMGGYDGNWSGDSQLWWLPREAGAHLTLTINAPETKNYDLIGYFTRAKDYGNIRLSINGGAPLPTTMSGYSPEVTASGPVDFGQVALNAGPNKIDIEVFGKDSRSTSYLVGIDGFMLK